MWGGSMSDWQMFWALVIPLVVGLVAFSVLFKICIGKED